MCIARGISGPLCTESSWNSLILCFARSKEPHKALLTYGEMRRNHPAMRTYVATFVALMKACGELKDVDRGHDLHVDVVNNGLLEESNSFLGNTLVHMYSKCGSFAKAQEVFETLPVRDVVSWTALITGIDAMYSEDAMDFFEYMQLEGVSPNVATFVCVLKVCSSTKAIEKGREIHIDIEKKGFLEGEVVIGNALVDMYAKCGSFTNAVNLFEKLPIRDKVSWTSLIMGYTRQRYGEKALQHFEQMQVEGICLDSVAYLCSLKACSYSTRAESIRSKLHSLIAFNGLLEKDLTVGNTLIDIYAESGGLVEAREVFFKIPARDLISWNALISGYGHKEIVEETHYCLHQMQQEGILPDIITFTCCLKACRCARTMDKAIQIHARVGPLEQGDVIGNALVDMYAKCGFFTKAQEVFDNLLIRNVVSWTVLALGYSNHGHAKEALNLYRQMQPEGVCPNSITYVCCLKACGILRDSVMGGEIYSEMNKKGSSDNDLVLGNALINMYAKCGLFSEALHLHEKLCVRDIGSWNALFAGYALHKKAIEAVDWLTCMQLEGLSPDSTSLTSILKACGSAEAMNEGRNMHDEIAKKGLFQGDLVIGNALIDMCVKCGLLQKAQEVFDELPIKDVVSWTALISGYAKAEHAEEALSCYERMQIDGVFPDAITFACILKACGNIGAIHKGIAIHSEIARYGLLEKDLVVGNSLIEMYVKCFRVGKAQEVFDMLPLQTTLSWTVLIGGYVERGETEYVFYMLERMREEGKIPDEATFVTILSACSHRGQVDNGELYFEAMIKIYDIDPTLEHYSCMVDLVCRAGLLERAIAIIEEMSVSPDPILWYIVMDACQKCGNLELGRKAFEHALCLDKKDPSMYACMCNIYADT